ncbi:hypothetical protein HPB47_003154 [Ixodes persulcatus]|uniref:Uncharacterized protein n=1 Tax=Ixodes persulcatus TaxID=34615 RepID=A0AC60PJ87_IXOPE|nr:hypothetical protein HPB47_003154 [Ixodes persulcatus]
MPARKGRTCFVPFCKGGYKSSTEKVSLFRAPSDPVRLQEWARNIKRDDKALDSTCVVCSRHFDERYVQRTFKHMVNGESVEFERERPSLTDDAVPTVFPDAPAYLTKPAPKKRKVRDLANNYVPRPKRKALGESTPDLELAERIDLPKAPEPSPHPFSDVTPPKSSRGMTYDKMWVLECVLMRMKSPQLYEHIRRHQIMALPSKSCLDKHMQGFKGAFGFNPKVFSALDQKTKDMDEFSVHGGLVFDELKLSENIGVKASGEMTGFVDLGTFTEQDNKTSLSDHGLVIMFQPFQGRWTQILGVFSSRGNVKAPLLSKLLLEATILAEKSGLRVDYWTGDGAPWNRALWKLLGIKASSVEITCKTLHPVDAARHLYMISDFPHLATSDDNASLTKEFDHGGLLYPSKPLELLVTKLENTFTVFFSRNKLHAESMTCFLSFIQGYDLEVVGCPDHGRELKADHGRCYELRKPNQRCAIVARHSGGAQQ